MTLYYESVTEYIDQYGNADGVVDSEFEYEVDVDIEDIVAYIKQLVEKPGYEEKPLRVAYRAGRDAAIREIFDTFEDFWEILEKDDYFYEFMKERYAEEAYREQEEGYEY